MQFKIEKKEPRPLPSGFPEENFNIARVFAKKVYGELGEFVRGIVLFGSVVQNAKTAHDIDILIIVDDVKMILTKEIVQTYRVILNKIIINVDRNRLHVQSLKFTTFWEYVRAGDPVAINILRYGVALVDTGFFDPLQLLLDMGRIRPSKESVYTYYSMSPASLLRAKQHMLSATVDLYWSVIDGSHAALMKYGEIPPTPDHVADLMEKTLIKDKLISRKAADTMREFYILFKKVVNREIKDISGKEYDYYKQKAEHYMNEIKQYLEMQSKVK